MELDSKIKELLISTKDEIKRNDFDAAYSKVRHIAYDFNDVGSYTKALIEAGVDPLRYTSKTPAYYLGGVKIPDYVVHVTKDISYAAFRSAIINKVIIEGDINVNWEAFSRATLKLVCSPDMAKKFLDFMATAAHLFAGIELEQI